jgi:hypothetical protein
VLAAADSNCLVPGLIIPCHNSTLMFLAVVRMPEVPDPIARAAAAVGLVRADAQRRLAGILPRVILVDDAAAVDSAKAALDAAGFRTIAFDPRLAPGADDRVLARSLRIEGSELVAISGVGVETEHGVPLHSVALMQRAIGQTATSHTSTTRERRFALGSAVLTGGLKMTKTVERTVSSTTETRESLLVLQRRDGEDVMLAEHRLDYRFLGAELQPTSHASFEATVARLRRAAPRARYDDRAARPGFVAGLPSCPGDRLDVALYLLRLADAIEQS